MRGALVQFMPTFLRPLPNVITFQYNPETMTHTWTQPESATGESERSNPLAVRGLPGEEFSFSISMDAQDMIADGSPIAQGAAMATRSLYTPRGARNAVVSDGSVCGGRTGWASRRLAA